MRARSLLVASLALTVLAIAPTAGLARQAGGVAGRRPGGGGGGAMPEHWMGPGPLHKTILGESDGETLSWLRGRGAVRLEVDYGAFRLVVFDGDAAGGESAIRAAGVDVRDEMNLIPLDGYVLDGTHPQDTLRRLPAEELLGDAGGTPLPRHAGLYLVQFVGPVRDRWRAGLEGTGAVVVQYLPMHAYIVEARPERVPALEAFAAASPFVQYAGAWQPAFRMTPAIRAAAASGERIPIPVTVQLAGASGIRDAMELLRSLATRFVGTERVGLYTNVWVDLDPMHLRPLAAHPHVVAIETRGVRVRFDERQGQTVAGNVAGSGPSAPGYLSWLQSAGFNSSQFTTFSVNVVDDSTSLAGHPDLSSSRIAFTRNPTNQGGSQGGHGFLNAHIVAGLNASTGSSFQDSAGYHYGLGMAPWARVGSTAIFGGTTSSPTSWENTAYSLGARISTNSWGFQSGGGPLPDYDSNAQTYDFLVRDARSGSAGNQELMIVFAAGNDGPGSNTVSTPGTAKNVLTVGASENDRQSGTDGCGIGNSGANDIRDIISFSSRGPVNSSGGDGRWKPEIVAPGTHIQAGVPQTNYDGSSVCNKFWPGGQTLYGWSSGTSHSTPAVAGGAALVRQWFLNQSLAAPSPAMTKAVLVNAASYLTGVSAGDTLPSNTQGMGRMDVGRAFDTTPKIVVDQTQTLGAPGQTYSQAGSVADSAQPFRVTLVWTDAPGPTSGAPWVNDLDLTVSVGGTTYRGNVFSGATSIAGGAADLRNNTESVFLPAGTVGSFTATVTASSIGGDGVPGNADPTDQDFALFLYNATAGGGPAAPVAAFTGSPLTGPAPLTVAFSDLSSGTITSWSWSFGDGATSTVQNPSHAYTSAGSYTVSLTVTGPGGSDVLSKPGYVQVSTPPSAGIADGSFESQTAGSAPAPPWTIDFGTGHVINPAGGTTSDSGMPTDGTKWCEVAADSTNNATPPSNPGGFTTPPSGGAGVSQVFSYPPGNTILEFSALFLRNENANQSTFNDWMSVDITDGSSTYNLYYADTFTATSGTSSKYGYAVTPLQAVSVDLATVFTSSTPSTVFTLTVQAGNGGDNVQPSKGYIDDVLLRAPVAAPVADFSGTPLAGQVPLAVQFTDLSTGSITSYAWSFGDGGTSSAQNPSHTYTTAGTYTVALTATGPGGSNTQTKPNYVTATAPPPQGLADGGFEGQTAGAAPAAPWTIDFGTAHVINPAGGTTADGGMPSEGVQWCEIGADGTNNATPPSNPGGVTNPPSGAAGISQVFSYPQGQTELSFTAVFLRNETANSQFNDWMSVDVSDGTTTWNLFFADTFTAAPGTSSKYGYAMTALQPVTVDLATLFPSSTTQTAFTLTASIGNGADNFQPSKGYVDAFALQAPAAAPVAGFTGAPTSGTAPLVVSFTDQSAGSVTSWSWTFGDGGTSSSQNPSHTYTSAGTYTVSLVVAGPGGSDTDTKVNYVTVSAPPPSSGIADGSFEGQAAGSLPAAPWTVDFGTAHVINPAGGVSVDGPMPADGTQWCEIAADGTNNATPPSNPGGVTVPPSGGAGISQSFSYPAGQSALRFDAIFLRNESANSQFNDWMSVDVSDGTTTWNVFYADTFTATVGNSTKYGFPRTKLDVVVVDLATLFPSSTPSTVFTITVQAGNGADGFQSSKGYVDGIRLQAPSTSSVPSFPGNSTGTGSSN